MAFRRSAWRAFYGLRRAATELQAVATDLGTKAVFTKETAEDGLFSSAASAAVQEAVAMAPVVARVAAARVADFTFHALHAPTGHLVTDDPFGVPALNWRELDPSAEVAQIECIVGGMDEANFHLMLLHFAAAHGDMGAAETLTYVQGRSLEAGPMSPAEYYLRVGGQYITAGVVFNTIQALFTRVFAKEMVQIMLDASRKDGMAAVAELAAGWKSDPLGTLVKTYRGTTMELALTSPSYTLFQTMKGALTSLPETTSTMIAAAIKAVSQTWPSRAKRLMMASDDPAQALRELVAKTSANPKAELLRGAPATAAREVLTFGTAEALSPLLRTLIAGCLPGAEAGMMAFAAACLGSGANAAATTLVTHPINHALTLQGKMGGSFASAFSMAMRNGIQRGLTYAFPTVLALLLAKQVAGMLTKSDTLRVDDSRVDWEHGAGADAVNAMGTWARAAASTASTVHGAVAQQATVLATTMAVSADHDHVFMAAF